MLILIIRSLSTLVLKADVKSILDNLKRPHVNTFDIFNFRPSYQQWKKKKKPQ